MIAAVLGINFVIWRLTWYLLFFAPGASSVAIFAVYRCTVAALAASLLLHSLIHLPKRTYYSMYTMLSSESNWLNDGDSSDDVEDAEMGAGAETGQLGASGYSGRRAIVAVALFIFSMIVGAGCFAGLAALAVLLVNPIASALVPAVTIAGFIGFVVGVAIGGYAAHYTMFVSGVPKEVKRRFSGATARRSAGNKCSIPRGYSVLLW